MQINDSLRFARLILSLEALNRSTPFFLCVMPDKIALLVYEDPEPDFQKE